MNNSEDLLFKASSMVAKYNNITLLRPIGNYNHNHIDDILTAMANHSNCRVRDVKLSENWFTMDSGALLAFSNQDNTPYALIPSYSGKYYLINSVEQQNRTIVDEKLAQTLQPIAYLFYQALPDKQLSWLDIISFAFIKPRHDVKQIVFMHVLFTLASLLTPVFTGKIIDIAIPNADYTILIQFIFALTVTLFSIIGFKTLQAISLARLQIKIDARMKAAIWDRLLNLPIKFFRDYNAGDLSFRMNGFSQIQQTLSHSVFQSLFNGILSFLILGMLFMYNADLTFMAIILVSISLGVGLLVNMLILKYQRTLYNLRGELATQSISLLNNLNKIRLAHSELPAFNKWSDTFLLSIKQMLASGNIRAAYSVFQSIFSILITITLFIMVTKNTMLSLGDFVAYSALFGLFFSSVLGLLGTINSIINIIPLYERIKPVIHTIPDRNTQANSYVSLTGNISINDLSFRYHDDLPMVLKNINLTIHPGEFIAIVGESGSGKSTLFRLLLGFEKPLLGRIYYDDFDLQLLEPTQFRNQLGVVLQQSAVLPGSIYENIDCARNLTIQQAWQAAELAGLAEDIKNMPMHMHTIISEGGKTLSLGQRQRLMIAAALVHQPNILLLDEATSALDNTTQNYVIQNLQTLHITRIVIAHRLSTIINADKIIVLEKGEIVETGSYHELTQQDGVFARLAKHQVSHLFSQHQSKHR